MSSVFDHIQERRFDVDRTKKPTKYQLKKMRTVHKRIAERVVTGEKDTEIAKALGVTPLMVAYTRESPVVKQYLGLLDASHTAAALDVAQEIQELSPFASRVLETLMLNPNSDPKLRAEIAKDLLDRAGHGAVKKIATAHRNLTAEDISDIKQRAHFSGIVAETAEIVADEDESDSD